MSIIGGTYRFSDFMMYRMTDGSSMLLNIRMVSFHFRQIKGSTSQIF